MYWLDHHALAEAMGIRNMLPVIIDASSNVSTLKSSSTEPISSTGDDDECEGEITLNSPLRKTPSNYLTFYMTPEKHAGYAITWYENEFV